MRLVIRVLIFLFLRQAIFAGCTGPILSTSFGIPVWPDQNGSFTVSVNPRDSFSFNITGGTCYPLQSATLSFNGGPIRTFSLWCSGKLPCSIGIYTISAENPAGFGGYFSRWTIQFIANPKVIDTTATSTQTTNLSPIKSLNPEFLFYPNPAHEEITLLNETDEIRSAYFYNSSGCLLSKYEVNDVRIKIPLSDYPPGLYFIHVATLSDKIIIKKITVL